MGKCTTVSERKIESERETASVALLPRQSCHILAMARVAFAKHAEVAEWQTRRIQNPVHASG